jgi:diguanylate cyclase (GGDEF)-like protein/PAS domain S-box-containing protein
VGSPAGHQDVNATRAAEVELFSLAGHDGYLRGVNDAFERLLGIGPGELDGRSVLELVHPEDLSQIVAGLAALQGGASEALLECRFKQSDGRTVHLQWVARPLPGTDLWWAAGRDTIEFQRLLAERLELRARLDVAIGPATAAMWALDVVSAQFTWEPQAAELLGVASDRVPTGPLELVAMVHPEDSAVLAAALRQLIEVGVTAVSLRVAQGEAGTRHLSLRGKVLDRDHRGRPVRAVGLVLDVTDEKAMEEQMLRMIMSDALTGAPNRRAFDQTLRNEWRRCTRAPLALSIVLIDIDDFKEFNDAFGHLLGDEALCSVSRALTGALHRSDDVVARFGGEEFAVVLPGTDSSGALVVAERLVKAVRSVAIRQAPGRAMSVSVGTASWHPEDPTITAADLLARADEALYAAKAAGKNRVENYERSLAPRATLQAAIARGIAEGEFELYYQPIVALATGAVAGFEALMRWNRPGYERVAPDDFIPIAETSSLICDLGRWALREACGQLATWTQQGLDPAGELRIAVNVSARHVATPQFVDDIQTALATAGIAPDRLELEVTETTPLDDALSNTHLAQLRALGICIAIDDFGTGYTSIGQLPSLPADTLKIDRSFIASADPRQRRLVPLIIEAAHTFDLRVVAEGIEDADTLQALRNLGCDTAQGYLIARPTPATGVAAWLAEWRANPFPPPAGTTSRLPGRPRADLAAAARGRDQAALTR